MDVSGLPRSLSPSPPSIRDKSRGGTCRKKRVDSIARSDIPKYCVYDTITRQFSSIQNRFKSDIVLDRMSSIIGSTGLIILAAHT